MTRIIRDDFNEVVNQYFSQAKCGANIIDAMKFMNKKIEERLDWWECSRGSYILSQEYRDELKQFVLTGDAEGLCNHEQMIKEMEYENYEGD